jgi:hypothetical protein
MGTRDWEIERGGPLLDREREVSRRTEREGGKPPCVHLFIPGSVRSTIIGNTIRGLGKYARNKCTQMMTEHIPKAGH